MSGVEILKDLHDKVNIEYQISDTGFEGSDVIEKAHKLGEATAYLQVLRHINDLLVKV